MTTATMNNDPAQVEQHVQRHAVLEQRVLLLSPTMGWWRGHYQLKAARADNSANSSKGYKLSIDGKDIDAKKTTKPQVKLLEAGGARAKAWQDLFQELDSERTALVEQYSESFPGIRGVRIVPRDRAAEFFKQLIGPIDELGRPVADTSRAVQSVAFRLAAAADRFTAEFFDLREDIRLHLGEDLWEQVSHKIPSRERIREKFYMDVSAIELSGSRADRVRRADIDQYEDLIRESTLRKANEAIEAMIAGPREALATALTKLETLIRENGRVTERSFNGVRQAIAKIRLFDFVANEDVLRQITELENRLDITVPKTLDSTTATSNGLFAAIDAVRDEVTDEIKQTEDYEKFGRPLRGLML